MSIIEFTIENFKIFKEEQVLSLEARKSNKTFKDNGYNLLTSSLIYGPNASGKSTILEALFLFRSMVIKSYDNAGEKSLPYSPFILSSETDKAPTRFEMVFTLNDEVFRYGFSYLESQIVMEELFRVLVGGEERPYFQRKGQKIELHREFEDGRDIFEEKTRDDVLFLSAASQWNNEFAKKMIRSFLGLKILRGNRSGAYRQFAIEFLKENKDKVIGSLQKADFHIRDFEVKERPIPNEIKDILSAQGNEAPDKLDTVVFLHDKINSEGEKVGTEKLKFSEESDGTQRFFDLLGPVLDSLNNGNILFIDELDSSLHPRLTKFIVSLFEKNNPKNAQLIATTHDTTLLSDKESFRKEHFWFTEKDKDGVGSLFSLAEFDLRNDTGYEKKYLEGRFGAVPFIDPDYE